VRLLVILMLLGLSGCYNGYATSYYPGIGIPQLTPYSGETTVHFSADISRDTEAFGADGYAVIGRSAFYGKREKLKNAKKQGEKIGAEIVLVYIEYSDTVSGVMPWMTPTTTTTDSSGSIYGTVGTTPYSGTYRGSATTRGTQTVYIPYSIRRYNQYAVYLSKRK